LDHMAIVKQISALMKTRTAAATKAGWFGVDSKGGDLNPLKDDAVMVSEIKMARSALQSSLGLKAVKMRLPLLISMSCTVTTGVLSQVNNVDINNCTEFGAIAGLFDEYRVLGGVVEFLIATPTVTFTVGTSSLGANSLFVMAYDPVESNALASTESGTQVAQHKLFAPRTIATTVASQYVGVWGKQDGEPYRFKFNTGKVKVVTDGAFAGQWKGTSAPLPDGYLKPYFQTGDTTARVTVIGVCYLDIEVRSRT